MSRNYRTQFMICIMGLGSLFFSSPAFTDGRLCGRLRTGNLYTDITTVRAPRSCPPRLLRLATFPDVFGDGSAGTLNVNTDRTLDGIGRPYHNITIQAGVVLRLKSGSMLRCTGEFVNLGTIEILPGAYGSTRFYSTTSQLAPGGRPAHPGGIAVAPASDGMATYAGTANSGPVVTNSIPLSTTVLRLPAFGGGGGGSGATLSATQDRIGGKGGGSAQIYCEGRVTNRGTIVAVGEDGGSNGGGGGAGGILIIGSHRSVTNLGTISVSGGNGSAGGLLADGPIAIAAGGGGAGGHVQIVAPTFTNTSQQIFAIGGNAGNSAGLDATTALIRIGGGQGGSLFANGGKGGSIAESTFIASEDGSDGHVSHLEGSPSSFPIGY